jgi:hypothetical protein
VVYHLIYRQLYKNYKLGQVEALNGYFLILWLLGDVFNLIGAVLTHQLQTQIILAAYFCSLDFCLMVQFFYYKVKSVFGKWKNIGWTIIEAQSQSDENDNEGENSRLLGSPAFSNNNHIICGSIVPVPLLLAIISTSNTTIKLQGNIPEVSFNLEIICNYMS